MHDRTRALRRKRRVRRALVPALSTLLAIIGFMAWSRVPGVEGIARLEGERARLTSTIDRLVQRSEDTPSEAAADGAALLPVRLTFADFVERIHAAAKVAGIDDMRIETETDRRGAVPAEGLRGFAGTLQFSGEWSDIVKFFSEVERGRPVMRIRGLLAEPTDNRIRVECSVEAWSMPTMEVAR